MGKKDSSSISTFSPETEVSKKRARKVAKGTFDNFEKTKSETLEFFVRSVSLPNRLDDVDVAKALALYGKFFGMKRAYAKLCEGGIPAIVTGIVDHATNELKSSKDSLKKILDSIKYE